MNDGFPHRHDDRDGSMVTQQFGLTADGLVLQKVGVIEGVEEFANGGNGRFGLHALLEGEDVDVLVLGHVVAQIHVRDPLLTTVEGFHKYGQILRFTGIHSELASTSDMENGSGLFEQWLLKGRRMHMHGKRVDNIDPEAQRHGYKGEDGVPQGFGLRVGEIRAGSQNAAEPVQNNHVKEECGLSDKQTDVALGVSPLLQRTNHLEERLQYIQHQHEGEEMIQPKIASTLHETRNQRRKRAIHEGGRFAFVREQEIEEGNDDSKQQAEPEVSRFLMLRPRRQFHSKGILNGYEQ